MFCRFSCRFFISLHIITTLRWCHCWYVSPFLFSIIAAAIFFTLHWYAFSFSLSSSVSPCLFITFDARHYFAFIIFAYAIAAFAFFALTLLSILMLSLFHAWFSLFAITLLRCWLFCRYQSYPFSFFFMFSPLLMAPLFSLLRHVYAFFMPPQIRRLRHAAILLRFRHAFVFRRFAFFRHFRFYASLRYAFIIFAEAYAMPLYVIDAIISIRFFAVAGFRFSLEVAATAWCCCWCHWYYDATPCRCHCWCWCCRHYCFSLFRCLLRFFADYISFSSPSFFHYASMPLPLRRRLRHAITLMLLSFFMLYWCQLLFAASYAFRCWYCHAITPFCRCFPAAADSHFADAIHYFMPLLLRFCIIMPPFCWLLFSPLRWYAAFFRHADFLLRCFVKYYDIYTSWNTHVHTKALPHVADTQYIYIRYGHYAIFIDFAACWCYWYYSALMPPRCHTCYADYAVFAAAFHYAIFALCCSSLIFARAAAIAADILRYAIR